MGGNRRVRWGTAAVSTAAVLAGIAGLTGLTGAQQAGAAGHSGGTTRAEPGSALLDKDVAAVRKAGGGKVKVLAQAEDGGGSVRARAGAGKKVPWDARFRAASTSKTFTAVVALQLAAEDKLSLDDTVEKWLPGVVSGHGNDGSRVTVRDLLRQTSGLFDYVDDPELGGVLKDFDKYRHDTTPARDYVAVAMRHKPLFTPGAGKTRWAYSNTNYLLLEMIIEKAGTLPWREQVEHRVIAPLGLRETSIGGANPFMPGPHAKVTLPGADGKPLDATEHSLQHTADSGVISSTRDVNTFFRALMGGKLLPPAQLKEMRHTVERTDDPEDVAAWPKGGYGLGVRETPLSCGGSYWHHEGDGFGSYTRTGVTQDGRRSVAISVTSDGGVPDQVRLNAATRRLVDHALCGKDG
ncbi:beta-lactamase family protein [Streptomyces sp. NBC_01186]|uniref:serine hydrolase domain-containing protein n=1 Tax=unclassified Streptomyces TaxID=2593676 RepID=UPI002DDA8A8B|nr:MULTISPECIES: serine hydrolase domain-containing protein [unclassified Streptomyces]WSB78412.1 beta-lactamase family protein [Streptomyces sp. NBC_01775]WSS13386.1 beta-lactamase family protein [Streptomyces sp. NBC_01186]